MNASRGLESLGKFSKQLKAQAKANERALELERARERQALAKRQEFQQAMAQLGVKRTDLMRGRQSHQSVKPAPFPRQRLLDNQAVLAESLSDEISIEHLIGSDERIAYHAPQAGRDIPRKLRAGTWTIEATLDLHGLTVDEARTTLSLFLNEQRQKGKRALRIIHGKGHGSLRRLSVLKEKVPGWLIQRKDVLGFVQAPENDGGSGALLVLLTANRH